MRINSKLFSLPPYISTGWENVAALHMRGNLLIVNLKDGVTISIPNLTPEVLELVFNSHATYLEKLQTDQQGGKSFTHLLFGGPDPSTDGQLKFGFNTLDGFGAAMQHNPAQANMPELPSDILQKISSITKIIAPDDINAIPKAEPHCNCPHCQIARAIHDGLEKDAEARLPEAEEISEKDLEFQQWEINQTGDKLFTVVNKLDSKEKYSVYLGHPIGCTCGKQGCEHIVAVLKS